MNRLARFSFVALILGSVSSGLGACQSLAGIEDRRFDGADSGDSMPSAACEEYCALAESVCDGTNRLYASHENCVSICALLPVGDPNEPTGNTVACRSNQLSVAKRVILGEPQTLPDYCAKAGPGGNGSCGSNCESYCLLYKAACQADQPGLDKVQYDADICQAKCKGLADTRTFSADANYQGDTLQCRLVHTSAATTKPQDHCVHAQLQAQTQATPPGPCIDDSDLVTPDCASYCQLEMAECEGANKVYESLAQCKAVCAALPLGAVSDVSQNSVGCRKYHSYNALVDPETHCPHTGPGGDGHCGSSAKPGVERVTGNCESYCILLQAACSMGTPGLDAAASFEGTFPSEAACQEACGELDGAGPNSGYAVSPPPVGATVQCRLLHVSRALSKPLTECAAALGGAPCQ